MSLSSLAPVTLGEGVRTDGPAEVLRLRAHTLQHEGTGVAEAWVEATNAGDRDVVLDRLDSVALDLPAPAAGGYSSATTPAAGDRSSARSRSPCARLGSWSPWPGGPRPRPIPGARCAARTAWSW